MKKLCYLLCLLMTGSCTGLTLNPTEKDLSQTKVSSKAMSKSVSADFEIDSLAMKSARQSDINVIMLKQVKERDGHFFLAISKEDALSIGVPAELYDSYKEYAESLNE